MSDNAAAHRDAFNMLCDELIGRGMSRATFSSKVLPDCVVKVEDGAGDFQNIKEWELWQAVRHTKFAKWFAPCRWISPNGIVLVMERTTPAWEFPAEMPVFLTDYKRENYGMLNGQLVCHDYGMHTMLEFGMTKRMRKVEWR